MLPDPDPDTHSRLLEAGAEAPALGASIMSAVVAFLVGALGAAKAADILREWAAEIDSGRYKLLQ